MKKRLMHKTDNKPTGNYGWNKKEETMKNLGTNVQ
jgi:hypothetical protein